MTHRAIRFTDGNNTDPDAPVWSGWYLSGNLAGIDVLVTFDTWVDIARYDFSIVEQSRPFGDETVPLLIQIVDCCFREVL